MDTSHAGGVGQRTKAEDIEIIRTLASRYRDSDIARVLIRMGRRTGKGNRWTRERVKSARSRASIPGRSTTIGDPDFLSFNGAARHCGVSDTTIARLVKHGLVTNEQTVPWAPWEIRRSQLESDPVAAILKHLRTTGKPVFEGFGRESQ